MIICQLATFFLAIILAVAFVVVEVCSKPNPEVEKAKLAIEQANSIQVLRTSSFAVIDNSLMDTVRVKVKYNFTS